MIFISAGHHPGARGARYQDLREYDEAVVWAGEVCQLLKAAGEDYAYVPAGPLNEKINFINGFDSGRLAVEIHFNDAWIDRNQDGVVQAEEHIGKGCETLYYPSSPAGKAAAEIMQRHLAGMFPPDRGAKPGWFRMDPRKGPDFFLASTRVTALIVEPAFISQRDTIIDNRKAGARAIADGILEIVSHARAPLDVA